MLPSDSLAVDSSLESAQNPLEFAMEERDRSTVAMVKAAVATRNVVMAFQPVVHTVRPAQAAFFEGLIRIRDENGRIIPARDFISTVESTELGREIDCLALDLGLEALTEVPSLRLSINMSARSIGYPAWMKRLRQGLARDETLGERLILEITETSAMLVPDLVGVFMHDMQAEGVCFALDNFGAGYTSIRHLREFLFDMVKIDRQFISGIADNPDNQVLTQALISIAKAFDMFTIAEAVENARDAAFLTEAAVDCMQGYHFGAPSIQPYWKVSAKASQSR